MQIKVGLSKDTLNERCSVVRRKTKERDHLKHVSIATEILNGAAVEANDVCFISSYLIQATLPHRKPEGTEWMRKNGNLTMHMSAPLSVGLPWGSYPRLLLVWLTTESIRNCNKFERGLIAEDQLRIIDLSSYSISSFMAEMGLLHTGGIQGTIGRLRKQMRSLFRTTISFERLENIDQKVVESEFGARVVECSKICWISDNFEIKSGGSSWVEISPGFFKLLTQSPVPLDKRALSLLKRSPMAIDIYCWATHRVSYLKSTTLIPWESLMLQIGSGYGSVRDFKRRFLEGLTRVQAIWPQLNAFSHENGLLIKPSPPQVRKLKDKIVR